MKSIEKNIPVSLAILIGSLLISLSILISGGVITTKKQPQAAAAPTQPQAKTEVDIVKNLKSSAKQLGLNQSQFDSCLDSSQKAQQVTADLDEGSKVGVTGTPAFFINGKFLGGAFPYQAFKEIIDKELAGTGSTNYKDYSEDLQKAHDSPQGKIFDPEPKTVGLGSLSLLGQESAKVTIVEFSDYQCPFCSRFYSQTLSELKREYINTGKVKLYYRDYPLTQIHIGAQKAAEAARCASNQGKYWEYHNLLFENQNTIF